MARDVREFCGITITRAAGADTGTLAVDNGRVLSLVRGTRRAYISPEFRVHVHGPADNKKYAPHAELTALLALAPARKAELSLNVGKIIAFVTARQA
eukprot:4521987-Amphidinium_carterae.1